MIIHSAAVVINPGSSLCIPVMIVKPKTTLCWSFTIKDYNCGFSVSLSKENSSDNVIIPNETYGPNKEHKGSVVIDNATTVYLSWDNSYSWFRSKTVLYSISIEQPKNDIEDKRRSSLYNIRWYIISRAFYEDLKETEMEINRLEKVRREKEQEMEDLSTMINHTTETYNTAVVVVIISYHH